MCNLCRLIGLFRSRASLEIEILALRHQLNILRRTADTWRTLIRGPRIITTDRQAPRIYPPMIPLCSRFDSVLFTPKMSAIASYGNYSRSPYDLFWRPHEISIVLPPGLCRICSGDIHCISHTKFHTLKPVRTLSIGVSSTPSSCRFSPLTVAIV